MIRFAVYLRTSTDDLQSPEDSKAWQLDLANVVIGSAGTIVREYHDVGFSRSFPWSRRTQAAQLLADLALPAATRGWDAVVIGETARAFGAPLQAEMVLPRFRQHGVALWLAETAGPYDHDNDAHALFVGLNSHMAKAERNRTRGRVRIAMHAHAQRGRFLGARPPYGMRIALTDTPHPNPE